MGAIRSLDGLRRNFAGHHHGLCANPKRVPTPKTRVRFVLVGVTACALARSGAGVGFADLADVVVIVHVIVHVIDQSTADVRSSIT